MTPRRRRQDRELIEQQDESDMPTQGQVLEEVELVAQPQGAAAAVVAGGQQQQEHRPQPQQAVLQEAVPGSVVAWAGGNGRSTSSTSPNGIGAAGRSRGGAANSSADVGIGNTRSGQRRTAVTKDRTTLLERLLHLRPPMFFGEYDPDKAESWTNEMERTFETMQCAEEDQVRLAMYQLKGAAHEWWRVQRQTHFQGNCLDHITWQQFLEVFHGEYFPDYAQRERRDQFYVLV
ncbi:hypothetical protein Taro_043082 [Colocasia esculenta]|uniref:Retrotransposon gag domain-containing protein n=1 Tax=Colocasia esculenta TaxID=4460 RepID=A0A843X0T3_COLES|nr:hypothetical protein [Colocasia esculenta]